MLRLHVAKGLQPTLVVVEQTTEKASDDGDAATLGTMPDEPPKKVL